MKALGLGLPTLDIAPRGNAVTMPSLGLALKRAPMVDQHGEDPVLEVEEKVERVLSAFQQRAKTEERRLEQITDSEYWVALCFETREQKDEFLSKLKLDDLGNKHVDGLEVAERLGVQLESPRLVWPRVRSSKLGDLT